MSAPYGPQLPPATTAPQMRLWHGSIAAAAGAAILVLAVLTGCAAVEDSTAPDNPGQGTIEYSEAELEAMSPREFFTVPAEKRISHLAAALKEARAESNKRINAVDTLTPHELEIINERRPADKSEYTDRMVFAEISEGIFGAGIIADENPSKANEAIKLHSAVVDPSVFDDDGLIEEFQSITQPGNGPDLYIDDVLSHYPPIHGGYFMGHQLGDKQARVAEIRDTHSGRTTTNLAVLVNGGTPEENWLALGALEEGYALDKALAELESK